MSRTRHSCILRWRWKRHGTRWRIVAAWFQDNRTRTTPGAEFESVHDITQGRMRRILVLVVIVAVGATVLAALWIFRGREISSFIDRYRTVEVRSAPIQSIRYERSEERRVG